MVNQKQYIIAPRGYATQFSEAEVPIDYATEFRNRFINGSGDAEKRRGIVQVGNNLPGLPRISGLHEFVDTQGETTLIATASGRFFKLNDQTETWSQMAFSFESPKRVKSVSFDDKLLFFNEDDRPYFTKDGESFVELQSLLEVGKSTSGTTTTILKDAEISAWATQTAVGVNDLVFNATVSAYGLVTLVSGAELVTTPIGTANAGIGQGSANQTANHRYQVIDLIELNIFPTDDPNIEDNVATAATGTGQTSVKVSSVEDWTSTSIRTGDWVYNTTRNRLSRVEEIQTSAIITTFVSAQLGGDSLTFLKPAAPHITDATVHFGRVYAIDSRDRKKIRICGTNNLQDWTIDAAQLDITNFEGGGRANTFNAGALQPEGEILKTLTTFQNLLVIGGRSNTYSYAGTQPFADLTNETGADFRPISVVPQGVVSSDSMANLGNDVAWLSDDGVQGLTFYDLGTLKVDPKSQQIRETLRKATEIYPEDEIKVIVYTRRSWMIVKIGPEMYVYSFAPITLARNAQARNQVIDSWYLFDGKFAQCEAFLVRQNGLLYCAEGSKVYLFDKENVYSDDGVIYRTDYQTGWLTFDEPRRAVKQKSVKFIEPLFEGSQQIDYRVLLEGDWRAESDDDITIEAKSGGAPIGSFVIGINTIGGSKIYSEKFDLNAFGKAFRVRFITEDDKGPDILGRYTFYFNAFEEE